MCSETCLKHIQADLLVAKVIDSVESSVSIVKLNLIRRIPARRTGSHLSSVDSSLRRSIEADNLNKTTLYLNWR